MKIRNGFVSNSSSSSFIVIKPVGNNSEEEQTMEFLKGFSCNDDGVFVPFSQGKCKFGWDDIKYTNSVDKLNWACLQAYYAKLYLKDNEPIALLKKLFKQNGMKFRGLSHNELKDFNRCTDAYIDHQSTVFEDKTMMEIFESMTALKNFLFCKDSFVNTGNDNY